VFVRPFEKESPGHFCPRGGGNGNGGDGGGGNSERKPRIFLFLLPLYPGM